MTDYVNFSEMLDNVTQQEKLNYLRDILLKWQLELVVSLCHSSSFWYGNYESNKRECMTGSVQCRVPGIVCVCVRRRVYEFV